MLKGFQNKLFTRLKQEKIVQKYFWRKNQAYKDHSKINGKCFLDRFCSDKSSLFGDIFVKASQKVYVDTITVHFLGVK